MVVPPLDICRVGAMTKRFAGVTFGVSASASGICLSASVVFGVCAVKPCRKFDWGFGFDFGFWALEGGSDARKRCGEGVCVGIAMQA